MSAEWVNVAERFARSRESARYPIELSGGESAASLMDVPQGMHLVSTPPCLLQSGVQLTAGETAERAASLAFCQVASALAARGALPAWAVVSATVPGGDSAWLTRFAERLSSLAEATQLQLVAGQFQRGPLTVCIQLQGLVEHDLTLHPRGAREGDIIYVSGELGGVAHCTDALQRGNPLDPDCQRRWRSPVPRIGMGRYIASFASSCCNVSQGLSAAVAELAHASGVGASVKLDALPLPAAVAELGVAGLDLALYGSGDFELCFTAPPSATVAARLANLPPVMGRVTAIGTVDAEPGVRGISARAQVTQLPSRGWRHFTGTTDIIL